MKKIFSIVLLVFVFSGCWNYKEIEDGVTVSAISIDTGINKKLNIGTEIITGSETSKSEYLFSEADSFEEGLREIEKYLSVELYFGHAEALVFGKNTDTEDIKSILSAVMNDNRFRASMVVAVSQDRYASEVFLSDKVNGNMIGYDVSKMLKKEKNSGFSCVYKLYERMSASSGDCFVSEIELGEDNRIKYSGVKNIWEINR